MNYLAQLFGLISLILLSISYQQTKKKDFLCVQIFANIFYFVQYILLSAFSAAGSSIISIFRTVIFYNYEKNNKKIPFLAIVLFEIIILIVGILTYSGICSIIPIFIAMLYAYATYQNDLKTTYSIGIFASLLWIVYNFSVGAYVAIVGSLIEFCASHLGLARLKKKRR